MLSGNARSSIGLAESRLNTGWYGPRTNGCLSDARIEREIWYEREPEVSLSLSVAKR